MSLVLKIILAVYVWSVCACYVIYINRSKAILSKWCADNALWIYATNMDKPTVNTSSILLLSMIPLVNILLMVWVWNPLFEKGMMESLDNTLGNIAP